MRRSSANRKPIAFCGPKEPGMSPDARCTRRWYGRITDTRSALQGEQISRLLYRANIYLCDESLVGVGSSRTSKYHEPRDNYRLPIQKDLVDLNDQGARPFRTPQDPRRHDNCRLFARGRIWRPQTDRGTLTRSVSVLEMASLLARGIQRVTLQRASAGRQHSDLSRQSRLEIDLILAQLACCGSQGWGKFLS